MDIGLTEKKCLVTASNDYCPTKLKDGKKTLPSDLGTVHEEAGNIIIQQIDHMDQQDCYINVTCEDTGAFFLLCHFAIAKNGMLKFLLKFCWPRIDRMWFSSENLWYWKDKSN